MTRTIPVGITVSPDDAPDTWTRRAFPTPMYSREADADSRFAAWEQPQLFSEDVRAAFRSLR
jgi:hypothetical protein